MTIKRFNNLWLMGIILSAVILVGIYVLKIIFPEFVIEVAQIDTICEIGHFIDNNKWAWYLVSGILSYFVCYFTFCACCRKRKLSRKENIITIICVILLYVVKEFLPNQYTALNISIMIFLPMLFKGDFKATAICFVCMNFLQTITAEIRNISSMIIDINYASFLVLMVDYYIMIWLLYCLFNYKSKGGQ